MNEFEQLAARKRYTHM